MRAQEKYAVIFALLLSAVFLAAVAKLTAAPLGEGFSVTTEKSAQEAAAARPCVNVNTASAEELETLVGIGPALAQKIVDYREEHGPFTAVEELLELSGIGEQTLAGFRHQITLEGEG